jgi:hypothetical protein
VARVARRESGGEHIASIAPKIKESHRISLCVEIFVPLLWRPALPAAIAPALGVLRESERHLGRWLVLAEIAHRAGDGQPLAQALERATSGPASARSAWEFVSWALDPEALQLDSRPTLELIARLSDRPSADKDPTFLFKLAQRQVKSVRPLLENLVRGRSLNSEVAVRAALYLARDHERGELVPALHQLARAKKKEALRGIAAAALFDVGERELALGLCGDLIKSRQLCTVAWAAAIRAASEASTNTAAASPSGASKNQSPMNGPEVLSEPRYRRIQLGWVE